MRTKEFVLDASIDKLGGLLDAADQIFTNAEVAPAVKNQLLVIIEELFVNIASYAYPAGAGRATIRITFCAGRVILQFTDAGVPFNPLTYTHEKQGAGLEIGGRGLSLVRAWTDEARYERVGGQNTLTLERRLE
jgi:sigma-B regulation protein RsbU (phosphoserine phosphatase)